MFKSTNPFESSSWSDAVHFTFEGYDTSPFWADDGKTYIVGAHAWQIERMIMGFELDFNTGEIIGDIHNLWAGMGGIVCPGFLHKPTVSRRAMSLGPGGATSLPPSGWILLSDDC